MNKITYSSLRNALVITLFAGTIGACDNNSSQTIKNGQSYNIRGVDAEGRPILGPWCMPDESVKPGQPRPYCDELHSMASVNIREAKLDVVVDGFKYPWAFEFLSENEVIVTEFRGVLTRVNLESGQKSIIEGLPKMEIGTGQRGLYDVALHPDYPEKNFIYFSFAKINEALPEEDLYTTAVARARLVDNKLIDTETIFIAEPYTSSPSNFGGALEFDGDGHLLATIGDRSLKKQAQVPSVFTGKIVRLTDDGEIPQDNPFVKSDLGVRPEIFALGVRNPQGLVYDPERDTMFETEHGPMGGDEVNIITAGKNYGWPIITHGMNYTYEKIGIGTESEGLQQPLYFYLPSRAVSSIAVYRGSMFEEWDGDLLVSTLRGHSISRLKYMDGAIKSEMKILDEINARIRDIKVAQDGAIWILAETGQLYRMHRNPLDSTAFALPAPGERSAAQIYNFVCATCHDSNVVGVPQKSDKEAWRVRLTKGREALYQSTLEGIGSMPPRGLCKDCTDEELRGAVNLILEEVNLSTN